MTSSEIEFQESDLLNEEKLKSVIRSGERHYVYVLCRPDGRPFYVGKGVQHRALNHVAEAKNTRRLSHKLNLIRSVLRRGQSIAYHIDSFHLEEPDAHARERELIASIGRHDQKNGPLTNQTDGGEGASNPSEESRERRRQTLWGDGGDDPERAEANRWFQEICAVQSVPVKPSGGTYKVEGVWRNRSSLGMKPRQAAALVASAIANRVMLMPGAKLPRRMVVENQNMILENGVARDTLSSDMAVLADDTFGHEILELTEAGYRFILDVIDFGMMIDAGIAAPKE